MCKPCATAAECTTTEARSEPARRRRTRKPTPLEEVKRIGAAALQAVGSFDFLMNDFNQDWEDMGESTPEAAELLAEFQAAGRLIKMAGEILARKHRKVFWDDALAPHTYGAYLRHAARLMDELERDAGDVGWMLDERDHAYDLFEVCPHLLTDRSAKNPAACPLCGSGRHLNIFCDDDGEQQAWVCHTCEGNVNKAKKVLKSKRVDKRHTRAVPKAKGKKKASAAKAAPQTAPAGKFTLPHLGEIDCRTAEEIAADEAAGIYPPQMHIPDTSKSKKPVKVPALHNRIAGIV